MTGFFAFIALILAIIAVAQTSSHSNAIKDFKRRIADLERRLHETEFKNAVSKLEPKKTEDPSRFAPPQTPAPEIPKAPAEPVKPIPTPPPIATPVAPPVQKSAPPVITPVPASPPPPPVQKVQPGVVPLPPRPALQPKVPNVFWQNLEKQFAENWTGILGAVIMVAGVIFLGVYAAVRLTPFNRFLLITGFAGLLVGLFVYLKRHQKWVKFALWLRSSAGAVFLFGCLGSAGIPGLQWVFNPLGCMLILDVGIIVNIFLGYIGGNQVYASLHVLLSLVALSIAPPATITLITAGLVTLFGVALTYKEKWNYHLLLTISSFFAFHIYWFLQQHEITLEIKIVGVATIVAISVAVALAHYRKAYETTKFDLLPFSVHVINWIYFSRGLFFYASGTKISTVFLVAGAIAAFFMARKAKKMGIRWLYHTDTLTAQAIAVVAVLSLHNWSIDNMMIGAALFIQVLFFLTIMLIEEQDFLYSIGLVLANITGFGYFMYSYAVTLDANTITTKYIHAAELFFCFAAGMVFILRGAAKQNKFPQLLIFFGIVMAGFVLALDTHLFFIGNQISTAIIFAVSVLTYFSGRATIKHGLRWFYQLLAIVGQFGVMLGLYTLHKWGADYMLITSIAFVEWIFFLVIMIVEDDKLLYTIGTVVLYIISILLLVQAFAEIDYDDKTLLYRHVADLAGCLLIGTSFLFYGPKKRNIIEGAFAGFGVLMGGMFAAIYTYLYYHNWVECPMVLIALALLFAKEKWKSEDVGITALLAMLTCYGICTYSLYQSNYALSRSEMLLHGLPLFVLLGLGTKWSGYYKVYLNWIGIYLFALHAVYLSYLLFNNVSSFIPGVAWLAMSPIALELSRFTHKRLSQKPKFINETDRFLLHIGYSLIALFLIRHVLVDLQSEQYLFNFIKVRFLIEIFAFGIFLYWASAKSPVDTKYKSWRIFHPLFMELIIGFFILTVTVEAPVFWLPILWIASAFAMAILGNMSNPNLSRLRFYSLIMYWITAFQVAFITSNYVTPAISWYSQPSVNGIIAILMQFGFLIYFYKKCKLDNINFPTAVSFMSTSATLFEKKKNGWIFFPLILCTALFLFYSFDKSILTLLWVVECFLVFILSFILKEKYFRYVALGAIVLCVLRLIFYDLAQTSALTRAFVFFGVGIIMLIMNAIYNKYKERFE